MVCDDDMTGCWVLWLLDAVWKETDRQGEEKQGGEKRKPFKTEVEWTKVDADWMEANFSALFFCRFWRCWPLSFTVPSNTC
jgi:hypothetical protein